MAAVGSPITEDAGIKLEPKSTLTPPASEEAEKNDDSGSELSDLDLDPDDSVKIVPDHYYGGGKIPVFKPVGHMPSVILAWLSQFKHDPLSLQSGSLTRSP